MSTISAHRLIRGSRAWRNLSQQVIAEEPQCWLQLPGCTGKSTTADHIINIHERPDLALERTNCRGACRRCNNRRGRTPHEQLPELRDRLAETPLRKRNTPSHDLVQINSNAWQIRSNHPTPKTSLPAKRKMPTERMSCHICGKPFLTKHRRTKYCSEDCRIEAVSRYQRERYRAKAGLAPTGHIPTRRRGPREPRDVWPAS